MKEGIRKIIVFLFCIAVGMTGGLYMEFKFYEHLLNTLMWISIAFFTSNGIEHVSKFVKAKTDINTNAIGFETEHKADEYEEDCKKK